jgi:hypothetical protein
VVYLQNPPKWAANYTMVEHLKVLSKPYPEGFSLSRARIHEALYRAGKLKEADGLLDDFKSAGDEMMKNADEKAEFADEDDQELAKLKEKLVRCLKPILTIPRLFSFVCVFFSFTALRGHAILSFDGGW